MSAIMIVRGVFVALMAFFALIFGGDLIKSRKNGTFEDGSSPIKAFITGFVTDFGDTIGIGSFAPTVAMFKLLRMNIADRLIPGTLNVAHTIPVLMEAFLFTEKIEVEIVTLVSMLVAAAIGSYIGAGIISRLDENKIRVVMGIALLATAILMLLSHEWVGLFPIGGDAIGLSGIKLVVAVVCNFFLGALMTAGIGLYAPCMALVYFLGMSPAVAFPIMMGSCAVLMPVASAKFVKEETYAKKPSLFIMIGGILGVIAAVNLVVNLPMEILKILVIIVILITAFTMLNAARKAKLAREENTIER